jgi:hypothetical protein
MASMSTRLWAGSAAKYSSVGASPRRPAKVLDDAAACDRERPRPEPGLVPFEGSNASGDGLPHLAGDVVSSIARPASQVAEQAGLEVFEEQPNRPSLAAPCRIDDRAEVGRRCHPKRIGA